MLVHSLVGETQSKTGCSMEHARAGSQGGHEDGRDELPGAYLRRDAAPIPNSPTNPIACLLRPRSLEACKLREDLDLLRNSRRKQL